MTTMPWVYDDGGRSLAGYSGDAGACVSRSLSIVMNRSYASVYKDLYENSITSPRNGIEVESLWFPTYMKRWGYKFVATPGKHFIPEDVPQEGRLAVTILAPGGHLTAVIDGVVHDTIDPSLCRGAIPKMHSALGRGHRTLSCKGLKMLGYWIQK